MNTFLLAVALALPVSAAEPWAAKGEEIAKAYAAYDARLQSVYARLGATLQAEAPDLYKKVKDAQPKSLATGYQVLPKLLPETPPPAVAPAPVLSRYNWPWAEKMIGDESRRVAALEAELAAARAPKEKRAAYEKMTAAYVVLPPSQRYIDTYIQYNKLWQPEIAAHRAIYDRQTALKDAVLERTAARDALRAPGTAEAYVRGREAALSAMIRAETDGVAPPAFVTAERPSSKKTVIAVTVATDIEDAAFLRAFKAAVEDAWRLGDEYRVALTWKKVAPRELYKGAPPKNGAPVDLTRHLALFPENAAILTTGAVTTHVRGRAIVIGPNEVAPHDLAHEFGHILGFRDVYFRGYRDLGADGFQVEEIVAQTDDIMGGRAPVSRGQFERLIAAIKH